MRCVLLTGGVFRGTAIRDFEAESIGDVNLSIDKRGDMLYLSSVLHTSYWAHLTKRQGLVQQDFFILDEIIIVGIKNNTYVCHNNKRMIDNE